VFRGGSWYYSSAVVVRAAYRDVVTPTYRGGSVGFRTVQTGCRQVLVNP
jgi:formylglycine-generating enzyme required for sulfatase activity